MSPGLAFYQAYLFGLSFDSRHWIPDWLRSRNLRRLSGSDNRKLSLGHDTSHFRYDPFARDVALDPGTASAPRIAVPHILPSSE
jgi:hypothetical protein